MLETEVRTKTKLFKNPGEITPEPEHIEHRIIFDRTLGEDITSAEFDELLGTSNSQNKGRGQELKELRLKLLEPLPEDTSTPAFKSAQTKKILLVYELEGIRPGIIKAAMNYLAEKIDNWFEEQGLLAIVSGTAPSGAAYVSIVCDPEAFHRAKLSLGLTEYPNLRPYKSELPTVSKAAEPPEFDTDLREAVSAS